MSIFGKLFKKFKKVARGVASVGQFVPGPVGAISRGFNAVDMVTRGHRTFTASIPLRNSRLSSRLASAQPQYNPVGNSLMSIASLPRLGRAAGGLVRRAGGHITRNAGTYAGAAATAGAILYDSSGNPVRRKRPRGKGITARELKSFTRVTHLLNKFCKTPAPTKRRGAHFGAKKCR